MSQDDSPQRPLRGGARPGNPVSGSAMKESCGGAGGLERNSLRLVSLIYRENTGNFHELSRSRRPDAED
jgi:hypothetical protein